MQTNQLQPCNPGWPQLPKEMRQEILANVPIASALILMRTAKSFRNCMDDKFLDRRFQNLTSEDVKELRKFKKGFCMRYGSIARAKIYKFFLASFMGIEDAICIPSANNVKDLISKIQHFGELLIHFNDYKTTRPGIVYFARYNQTAKEELESFFKERIQGYRDAFNMKNGTEILYNIGANRILNFSLENPPNALQLATAQVLFSIDGQAQKEGLAAVEKLAEVEENLEAQFVAGQLCLKYGEYIKAQRWFEKAARYNDAEALYQRGIAGRKNFDPYVLQLEWYKKAADLGHAAALYELSENAEKPEQSLALLKSAADKGHLKAMRDYAERMLKSNKAIAAEYYFHAASRGDGPSQATLVKLYLEAGDQAQATKWLGRNLETHGVY